MKLFRLISFSILLVNIFIAYKAVAQDDLLKALQAQTQAQTEREIVIATFKGDRIINVATNETVRKNNLDFRVSHLFGNVGEKSGGGPHNLYGLDQSADIRIGFHYGLTDRLMVGVGRSKRNENLEGLVKFRLMEQTTNNHVPVSVSLAGNATYSARSKTFFEENIHRLNYFSQVIIARKISTRLSLVVSPGYLHRNFVEADDKNNTFSLSGGMRFKFTRSSSVILDYSHTFNRKDLQTEPFDVLGAGVEIETGGHVFSVMFSNASGILENDYLVNTYDSWGKGGFKLSFIISRMFPMGNEERVKKKK